MSKITKTNKVTIILLAIYLVILTWIILFKMQFSLDALPYIRSINLIPFRESVIINGKIDLDEIFDNVLVFIPVGVYISMLNKDKSFFQKLLPILVLTLSYESLQYIFHIGATDITDIITNTSGGIIGIFFLTVLYKVFKNSNKVDKVLNILALICSIGLISFFMFLLLMNL